MGEYELGDTVQFTRGPQSRVIGIDAYECKTFSGEIRRWTSYTLQSDDPAPFNRWYVTNPGEELFCWVSVDAFTPKGRPVLSLSGLCALTSQGDASLSTSSSAVLVFEDGDGQAYTAIETFDDGSLLYFKGSLIESNN